MEAASSPLGVAIASSAPSSEWLPTTPWVPPAGELSVRLPTDSAAPVWSRPAQGAAVLLLLLALALLGWHTWAAQRGSCRPATLESDAVDSPSLDLNRADHAQLLQLPGVGDNLAQRIEAYRAEHHGFRSVDELRQVGGIGPKMLEKLRPFVYVEARSSEEDNDEPAKKAKEKPPPVVGKKGKITERLDVNRASASELQRLPGIGPKLSQRIVETRRKKPFQSVDDLRRVSGIGPKILERLRPHVLVEGEDLVHK
jgi:competence protein ComEA